MYLWIILGVIALVLFSKRGDFVMFYAQQAYAAGDDEGCMKLLARAKKIGGMSLNSRMVHGFLLFRLGAYEDAHKEFKEIRHYARNKEQKMRIRMTHALVYWKRGELDDAVEMLEGVVQGGFVNTAVYGSLGMFYILKGDLDKALRFNTIAYEYNSDDATIVDNMAYNHYLLGDYDSARKYYEECIKLDARFPECYYFYGKLLIEALGERERGLELLHTALSKRFTAAGIVDKQEVEAYIRQIDPAAAK